MKLVLSCGHDGTILVWGAVPGATDKIQVCVMSVIVC